MRGLRGVGIQGLEHPVFSAASPGGGLFSTILSYKPIAYWPLGETSGTEAINYGTLGSAANGTYSGPTLAQIAAPGGGLGPLFDGVNDKVGILTDALKAAFNGNLGTIIVWLKVYQQSVWTDSSIRFALYLGEDVNNRIRIGKDTPSNTLLFGHSAGGTLKTYTTTSYANTNWHLNAMVYSDAANAFIPYIDGVSMGTISDIGTYSGDLESIYTAIGASGASNFWYGYLSHAAIFTSVLTAEQIAAIYANGSV